VFLKCCIGRLEIPGSEHEEETLEEGRFLTQNEDLAVAFRSTAVSPRTIVKLAKRLDSVRSLSRIFIPEGSQGSFTSLDICSACLSVSKRLRIGSGVIRVLEHEPSLLARRLLTLQEMSNNRFILGIGTGRAGNEPKLTIRSMLERLHSTRKSFEKLVDGLPGLKMPETFIATLRKGIAKTVADHSDGILLNFCQPEHARDIVTALGDERRGLIVSCYLKIFYSRNMETANRMLIEEFANYDQNPSYHKMFELAGVAEEIAKARVALSNNESVHPSLKLLEISHANPTKKELEAYISSFREAGVDLPCLYPYFEPGEDEAFKISKIEEIVRL
jgi:hypothetical protein